MTDHDDDEVIYRFPPGDVPTLIGETPAGWRWVELCYAPGPLWRKTVAVLPDGRVLISGLVVFQSEYLARQASEAFGRPTATRMRGAHLYIEAAVALAAVRKDRESTELLREIVEVARATVAGRVEELAAAAVE